MKRLFDIIISLIALSISIPILLPVILIIFLQDFESPLYFAPRVGKNKKSFKMIKLRSMVVNADKTGVDSTTSNDNRITRVGKIVRKYKLDEIPQFLNVLKGDMTIVGPRPNVRRETELYTLIEQKILLESPGITDIASIVFSDESDILAPYSDPDLAYNQLIRPRKSILALFYLDNKSFIFDLCIIYITFVAIINKKYSIYLLKRLVAKKANSENIRNIVSRKEKLVPIPPPGSKEIVKER